MASIEITLYKDRVDFKNKAASFSLVPVIHTEIVKNKEIVKSIGTEYLHSSEEQEYTLFRPLSHNKTCNHANLLTLFFSYGLKKMKKELSFLAKIIPPAIHIHQAEILNDVLCGYQYFVLHEALILAGARKVVFHPHVDVQVYRDSGRYR